MKIGKIVVLFAMLASGNAFAATTHVAPGGNVQSIINAAAVGDTIFFDPGTYNISNITLKSGVTYHADIHFSNAK